MVVRRRGRWGWGVGGHKYRMKKGGSKASGAGGDQNASLLSFLPRYYCTANSTPSGSSPS